MKKIVFVIMAALIGLLIWGSPANATRGREDNVTLCHATHSDSNPFVVITVDPAGAFDGHLGDGRGNHQDGEDIIPPFVYEGETYSQNWNEAGQAIFNNGCEVPDVDEPTTTVPPTTTTTLVVTPTTVPTTSTTVDNQPTTVPTTQLLTEEPVGTPPNEATTVPSMQLARTGFGTFILKVALALIIIGFVLGVIARGRRY